MVVETASCTRKMAKRERKSPSEYVSQQPEAREVGALPVVAISRSGRTLYADFQDDDEEPDCLQITELLDDLEYTSILLANGKTPRGKTCRALLKCNDGSLVYNDQKYRIKVHATRELSDSDHGRVGQNLVPIERVEMELPDSPKWRAFERTGENEQIFKRYIRYALYTDGFVKKSAILRVDITILDKTTGQKLYRVPTGASFEEFAGLKEGNCGEQPVLIQIQNANQEVDGVYFVKSTTTRSMWAKELFVGRLVRERTNHPSFLAAKFGFRYRKEARNHAQEYYALAIPFQPSWSISRVLKVPQPAIAGVGEVLTERRLILCLYSLVDALLSAHPDRIRGNAAIDFRHCDLHPGNVLIGRETNTDGSIPCWLIDFSHADIFYSERNADTGEFERKHLVGSIQRRDQEFNFVATSAARNEVGALVKMFSALLRRFNHADAAKFLEAHIGEMSTRTNAISQLQTWLDNHSK